MADNKISSDHIRQLSAANWWEFLTFKANEEDRAYREGQYGEAPLKKHETDLERTHCWEGQELTVIATNKGWVLEVHSCHNNGKVRVLIPSNPSTPVKVLQDDRNNPNVDFYDDNEDQYEDCDCECCNWRV